MNLKPADIDAIVRAINSLQRALGITAIVVAACLALSLLVCASILAKAIEGHHACARSSPKSSTAFATDDGATIQNGHPGSRSTPECAGSDSAGNATASTAERRRRRVAS